MYRRYPLEHKWAKLLRSLAVHGKSGEDKYDNVRLGMNSRLDTFQAAILQVKLKAFVAHEMTQVNQVACWYDEALKESGLLLPTVPSGMVSSWAQYTVRLSQTLDCAALQARLSDANIPSMIYYRKPMHCQGAFAGTRAAVADCPVTKQLCNTVLSLPMGRYIERGCAQNCFGGKE